MSIHSDEESHEALPLSPEDGRFCLFSIRFSQDGREILGGANDGYLYLYDREEHQQSLKVSDASLLQFHKFNVHLNKYK